ISFVRPSRVEKAVEDRNIHIGADRTVPTGEMVIANRGAANGAQGPDGGQQQVALGVLEFLAGLELIIEREHFRPLRKRFRNQAINVARGNSGLFLILDQDEIMLGGKAQNSRKIRERGLVIVLCVEQQQFRLRQIYIGKTQIQVRLEFVF